MDETHLLVKCDVEEEARHRNELISEGKATGKPVPLRDNGKVSRTIFLPALVISQIISVKEKCVP